MSLVEKSQRQHLKTLTPYASARRSMSGGNVWLNANESPFDNGYRFDDGALNRYPQFQSEALNTTYADYAGVQPNQVLSTRGSDEGIELLIRAFCEPGQDNILICPPTYGMYAISAKLDLWISWKSHGIAGSRNSDYRRCERDRGGVCQYWTPVPTQLLWLTKPILNSVMTTAKHLG